MRLTQLFGKTVREVPAEAETASHLLMLKAGMIYQVAAGVYAYMPLAWRALRKIEQIIREEMDAAGGQELVMPALQPLELWQQTGRDRALGEILFRLKDRRDRWLVMAPTHEEVITELVKRNARSYRDLPLLLYQIQTKFRDEPRPRGGLLRVREFDMKDAYSFHTDPADLDVTYQRVLQAYRNIYDRCGLPAIVVEADSGAMGGRDSHEFTVLAETGEDKVAYCSGCSYAANVERAEFMRTLPPPGEPLPLEEVSTPGIKTIEQLALFLRTDRSHTLKAVFYSCDREVMIAVIRGDLEVNEVKLANALRCANLRLATAEEVADAGLVAGSASPVGLHGIRVIADPSVTMGANLIAGGNKPDVHLRNVNYGRDFEADILTDIAVAEAGYLCVRCQEPLKVERGIEVGHIFKLGTGYSDKLGATFLDKDGAAKPIHMGCYGIGVGRLLAAAIEYSHDDKGIIWPDSLAPYQIHLTALSMDDPSVVAAADALYVELTDQGYEVLFDDRVESPGVKFNDADLLGMPLRLTISPRTLRSTAVEVKRRTEPKARVVPRDEALAVVAAALGKQA